jgi:hypothetical protein
MKTNFYMIAVEEINQEIIAYGIAYNLKNEIQWKYSFNTHNVELVESIAGPKFHKELLSYIEQEIPNIEKGNYMFTKERVEEAKSLIVSNAYNRQSYVG